MKHKVPKVIYLQICDDPDCDIPYDDHDGITWCSHRIDKTDVKYVLSSDKPQRQWVDLTDDEMLMIYGQNHEGKKYNLGRMVQQALKQKNGF
jgi:hypothetical protein